MIRGRGSKIAKFETTLFMDGPQTLSTVDHLIDKIWILHLWLGCPKPTKGKKNVNEPEIRFSCNECKRNKDLKMSKMTKMNLCKVLDIFLYCFVGAEQNKHFCGKSQFC